MKQICEKNKKNCIRWAVSKKYVIFEIQNKTDSNKRVAYKISATSRKKGNFPDILNLDIFLGLLFLFSVSLDPHFTLSTNSSKFSSRSLSSTLYEQLPLEFVINAIHQNHNIMPSLSLSSSPSAVAAGIRVHKATSELLVGPDWTMNMEICDFCNNSPW